MSQATIASAGTAAAATGGGWSSKLFFAANSGLWWQFFYASSSTTTLLSYSSPDLVTWTAGGTLTTTSILDGRDFAAAYANIGGVDVIHLNFTHVSATSHVRATISGTTISYGTTVVDSTTGSVVHPSGNSGAIDSTGRPMDLIPGGKNGDPAAGGATNADSGTSWTTGFGTVANVNSGGITNNASSSTLIPMTTGRVLAITDDGGGASPPVSLTDLLFGQILNTAGTITHTTALSWRSFLGGTPLGTAQNANCWAATYIADNEMPIILASGTNTWTHKTAQSQTGVTTPAIQPGSTIGAQAFNSTGGVALVYDGTTLWLFCLDAASGNDIRVNSWTLAVGWSGWTGLGLASATRNYLTASQNLDGSGTIGLTWMEGTSPFNVCATAFPTSTTDTAATTLALPAFTLAAAAAEVDSAAVTLALPAFALGATAAQETAAAGLTLPALMLNAAATEIDSAAVGLPLPPFTLAAAAASVTSDTAAVSLTLPPFSLAASAAEIETAATGLTLPAYTLAATGAEIDAAATALTLPPFALAATAGETDSAAAGLLLPPFALSAIESQQAAHISLILPAYTLTATAAEIDSAAAGLMLAAYLAGATGALAPRAAATLLLPSYLLAGSASIVQPAADGVLTLNADTFTLAFDGVLSLAAGPAALSLNGASTTAALTLAAGPATLSMTGVQVIANPLGMLTLAAGPATLSLNGEESFPGFLTLRAGSANAPLLHAVAPHAPAWPPLATLEARRGAGGLLIVPRQPDGAAVAYLHGLPGGSVWLRRTGRGGDVEAAATVIATVDPVTGAACAALTAAWPASLPYLGLYYCAIEVDGQRCPPIGYVPVLVG